MPKQRLQVQPGIPQVAPNTPAAPVDTYVRPPENTAADQLAAGLSKLAPALGRLTDTLQEQNNAANLQAGRDYISKLHTAGKKYADEVKAGRLAPSDNPFFMAGLREQEGRVQAQDMGFAFQTALGKDEQMQQSTDPADFEKFQTQFFNDWKQQNGFDESSQNPYFLKGFAAMADALVNDQRTQWASQLANRVVKVSGDLHFQETFNDILAEQGRNVTRAQIAASITARNDAAALRGLSGEVINRATVDAVARAAKKLNDPTLATELLDLIQSGPADSKGKRPSLSSTKYAATVLYGDENSAGLLDEIGGEAQSRNSRAWNQEDHAKQTQSEDLLRQANARLLAAQRNGQDVHSVDISDLKDQMNVANPAMVGALQSVKDNFDNHTLTDSPLVVAAAFRDVFTPPAGGHYTTMSDAAHLLNTQQISMDSYLRLTNVIQERDSKGNGREHDPYLDDAQGQIRRMFVAQWGDSDSTARQLAEQAVDEFTLLYLNHRQGTKGETAQQLIAWIHDNRLAVAGRWLNGPAGHGTEAANAYNHVPAGNLDSLVPHPQGPRPVDPKQHLTSDQQDIISLQNEFNEWTNGRRSGLSPRSLAILRKNNIVPDHEAVAEFLQHQAALLQH